MLDFFNSTDVAVKTNSGTSSYAFTSDNDTDYSTIIIAPYYPEDNIAARATMLFSSDSQPNNDIFISHQLANLLDLNQSETSAILSFNVGIPIYTTNVELTVGNANSTYSADIDVSKIVDFELNISGILDYNYVNNRSTSGDNVIYMPIAMMLDYISNTKAAYPESTEKNGILFNSWAPSTYSVYVKSFNDIQTTISKIESIDPNLKAVSAYQDVASMNEMISSIKSTASYVILVVLLIVLILMTIIYTNNTLNRKYEIAVLKANGLNKVEAFEIVICEAFIHMLAICVISILVMILISNSVNLLFNFDVIQLSFNSIITVSMIATTAILAPTVSSLLIINNFKPDRIMRN
jgi:ABC-type antimicrobial peptide transport system permease subunit